MATNKVTTNVIDMSGNTGGLVWAKGTEAQRPTGVAGDLRLNTTDSRLEYKDNADWKRFSEGAASPSTDFEADFLVVAGGGGGSSSAAGNIGGPGAGAGGLRTSFGSSSGGGSSNESKAGIALSTSYTVTVGAGGNGATTNADGADGSDSVFSTITSIGGGGGAKYQNPGRLGGSGGGVYAGSSIGSGTANQGFNGGTTTSGSSGGAGGGAALSCPTADPAQAAALNIASFPRTAVTAAARAGPGTRATGDTPCTCTSSLPPYWKQPSSLPLLLPLRGVFIGHPCTNV